MWQDLHPAKRSPQLLRLPRERERGYTLPVSPMPALMAVQPTAARWLIVAYANTEQYEFPVQRRSIFMISVLRTVCRMRFASAVLFRAQH